jgi:hypothetical protein
MRNDSSREFPAPGPSVVGSVGKLVLISNAHRAFHYGKPLPGQERIPKYFCIEAIARALSRSKHPLLIPANDCADQFILTRLERNALQTLPSPEAVTPSARH